RTVEGLVADRLSGRRESERRALAGRQRQVDSRAHLEARQRAFRSRAVADAGLDLDIEAEERPIAANRVVEARQLERHAAERSGEVGAGRGVAAKFRLAGAQLDLRAGDADSSRNVARGQAEAVET